MEFIGWYLAKRDMVCGWIHLIQQWVAVYKTVSQNEYFQQVFKEIMRLSCFLLELAKQTGRLLKCPVSFINSSSAAVEI